MADLGFPAHWSILPLEDVADVFDRLRVPLNESQRQGMSGVYPYCGANGILDHIDDYIFDGEYVLLAEDGGYWGALQNSAYLMSGRFWVNNHAHILQGKPERCDNQFLVYQLQYMSIDRFISGTTRGKLTQGVMLSIPIAVPPLHEQTAIAETLRAVQDANDARARELELEKERKAVLMDYLFTNGTRGEPTKLTEIGEIPEGWETVRLEDASAVRYGLGQPPELDEDGIPMVRATDIKSGRIVSDRVIRVKRSAIPSTRNPFLEAGDVLVVRSGAYTGDVAMYDGRWDEAIAGYDLVVSPDRDRLNSVFLAAYLLSSPVQGYFRGRRDRSAQPHLNSQQLADTVIPIPEMDEQGEIARVLTCLDARIIALEKESSILSELFWAMLGELMTGKLSAVPLIGMEGHA